MLLLDACFFVLTSSIVLKRLLSVSVFLNEKLVNTSVSDQKKEKIIVDFKSENDC